MGYNYLSIAQFSHYDDVIMGVITSQITSLTIIYSSVYSDADQRKHQSSASLAFVRGIHRGPMNSPHKGPVKRKMFPFDDVIMNGNFAKPPLKFRNVWVITTEITLRDVITYPCLWLISWEIIVLILFLLIKSRQNCICQDGPIGEA